MNTGYEVLKKEILPQMTNYQNDVLVHDKKLLDGYRGSFVTGYRTTGTNTFLLDKIEHSCNWSSRNIKQSIVDSHESRIAFMEMNKEFMLVDGDGSFKKLLQSDIEPLLDAYKNKAFSLLSTISQLAIDLISNDLFWFIQNNGRMWKSRLKCQWSSNSSSTHLARLRNRFNHDVLDEIKREATTEEIYAILINSYIKEYDAL